jgi:ABC-type lipoprotein release transport system permease subunit
MHRLLTAAHSEEQEVTNQKTVDVKAWAAVLAKLPEAEANAIVRHLEVAAELIKSATQAAEGWKAKAEEARRANDMATNALAVVAKELTAWRNWAKATDEGNQEKILAASKAIEIASTDTVTLMKVIFGGKP